MSTGRRLLGRAFDLTVYVPIGLAVEMTRCATRAVNGAQHRAADRIVVARAAGQLAVQVGGRRLRELLDQPDPAVAPGDPTPPSAVVTPLRVIENATPNTGVDADDASDLPIDEYESLAASQVVARLTALDAEELAVIEQFELTNRRRRTVLGKIEQLQRA